MKRSYMVGVREVHVRFYSVRAEGPEEARELVNRRGPSVKDENLLEYSHELDRDTWSIEETSTKDESTRSISKEAADRIFDIVCDSDWPEQPDAWPEVAILRALEELRQQQNLQQAVDTSVSDQP